MAEMKVVKLVHMKAVMSVELMAVMSVVKRADSRVVMSVACLVETMVELTVDWWAVKMVG